MSWPSLEDLFPGTKPDPQLKAKRDELIVAAAIDVEKDRLLKDVTKQSRASETDDHLERKLHEALAGLIVGSIERSRSGAQFVQTAATAIGGLYTGIVALVLVSDTPLPVRGLLPTVFLATAVVLATAYLAFITRIKPIGRLDYARRPNEDAWRRIEYLSQWVGRSVHHRAGALRAGVLSLAFGVAFLPVGFLPDNALDPAKPATAAAEPTISWPSPPPLDDPQLAAVLYEAQLRRFEAELDEPQTADTPVFPTGVDWLALIAAVICYVLVLGVLVYPRLAEWLRPLQARRKGPEPPQSPL